MEENQSPVCVCETEVTEEKYGKLNEVLWRRIRALPVLYLICGVLIALLEGLVFLVDSLTAGVPTLTTGNVTLFCIGIAFIALGIFLFVMKKKGKKKGYETYLHLNPDPHVHMAFFPDRVVVSSSDSMNTYYYENVTSWAEAEPLFLLYLGNRLSQVAVFVFKDGFATKEDEDTFRALFSDVLAGKKYKKYR